MCMQFKLLGGKYRMSANVKNNLFLNYPDLQGILEGSLCLLEGIIYYRSAIAERLENLERYFSNQKDISEAKVLYERFLELLDDYHDSYEDLLKRETGGKESVLAPFFKDLGVPINHKNPHITFDMKARFKSWKSFVEKAMTLLETKDIKMLDTFYDIHGCKFTVHSKSPVSVKDDVDYDTAESEVYELCNTFINYMKKVKNADLLQTKDVGPTSDAILEEYRPYVKDYFKNPKPNGYRALHVAFAVKVGEKKIIFEAQFNTMLCELNSADGSRWSHAGHKKNTKLPLALNFEKITYNDFLCYRTDDEQLIVSDSAGLLNPKKILKDKTFQKIV